MLSIAIPSLNFCGGAEAVTLELLKYLSDSHRIRLITVDKPNWNKIRSILNYEIKIEEVYKIDYDLTEHINAINITRMIIAYNSLLDYATINMYGDLDLFIDRAKITYINGIPFSIIDEERAPIYLNSIIRRVYKHLVKPKKNNILISNSFYTRSIIKERLGLDSIVIHPPLTIDRSKLESREKEEIVLTVTRIARGKKLERVLEIAERLKDTKFVIVGRVYDYPYYYKLLEKSKQINNLTIIVNKPRDVMIEYMNKAKILLHTMDYETYGLSIIEGMIAKCIPIVPRNGGPWMDILDSKNGVYGYAYNSIDEAIKYIEAVDYSIADNAYTRAIQLSEEFYDMFRKVIDTYITYI
ncbi:MAG: glycosyltransferase family 4 protein [Candidatus Nitrosocaldaceae archaeon]